MRIASAIVLLLLAAGCQRAGAPQPPPATNMPANAAATELPVASTVVAPKATTKPQKKASAGVLATVAAKNPRRAAESQYPVDDNDPCAGLEDAALDDCLARDDAAPANSADDRDGPSPDRPELTARDRELMEADENAAQDRDRTDPPYDGSDNGAQDDPSEFDAPPDPDEYPSPEDIPPPDDYPPDERPPDNG